MTYINTVSLFSIDSFLFEIPALLLFYWEHWYAYS